MTLYKINPLRIQKIPSTIKNYPWPCGSKSKSIRGIISYVLLPSRKYNNVV